MNTWLPYPSFEESARALDNRRLGKQRVEAMTILMVLARGGGAWFNHPAVRMWDNWRDALVTYGVIISREWRRRGYKDTCLEKIEKYSPSGRVYTEEELRAEGLMPPWVDDPRTNLGHRSSLVRKNPAHYRPIFPDVPDDLPYYWPAPPRTKTR